MKILGEVSRSMDGSPTGDGREGRDGEVGRRDQKARRTSLVVNVSALSDGRVHHQYRLWTFGLGGGGGDDPEKQRLSVNTLERAKSVGRTDTTLLSIWTEKSTLSPWKIHILQLATICELLAIPLAGSSAPAR